MEWQKKGLLGLAIILVLAALALVFHHDIPAYSTGAGENLTCTLTTGMRGIYWQPNPATNSPSYVYPAEQNVFGSSITCNNTGNVPMNVSISLNDTYALVSTVASTDGFASSLIILNTTSQLLAGNLSVGSAIHISLYRNYSNLTGTTQKNVGLNISAVPS